MKKLIRKVLGSIYNAIVDTYDGFTAKECEVSVGDIILERAEFEHCQFLLTTRILDVTAYMERGDITFPYQNTVSRSVYGFAHKEEQGNQQFIELIESYKEKGYDSNSLLTVDRECRLIDGNHRMGLNLYMGIEKLNVRVLKRTSHFSRNLDRYLRLGIKSSFMTEVINEFQTLQKWLIEPGNTFCCLLQGEYENENVSLLVDLHNMVNVMNIINANYNGGSSLGAKLIQFSLDFPDYCIKERHLVSNRAVQIEMILQERIEHFRLHAKVIVSKNCLEGKEMKIKITNN